MKNISESPVSLTEPVALRRCEDVGLASVDVAIVGLCSGAMLMMSLSVRWFPEFCSLPSRVEIFRAGNESIIWSLMILLVWDSTGASVGIDIILTVVFGVMLLSTIIIGSSPNDLDWTGSDTFGCSGFICTSATSPLFDRPEVIPRILNCA
uniref:(northern house mosquito) hypothetical protein n=1 Tax=Culex pipiens TaxID=7175 RepID=A0A8D8KDL3_CULPI